MLLYIPDGYLIGMGAWLLALGAGLVLCLKLRRRWKTQRTKVALVHAALSLWMFVASITALELGFALFYDRSDSFNLTNVSRRWFERHVQLNGQSFRDDHPFSPALPEGTKRLVFMGDSFTFGHGVPDVASRFSDRVGADLEQQHPGKWVVNNLGVPGLDPKLIIKLLQANVLDNGYRVDVLVYTICLNDIEAFHDEDDEASKLYGRLNGMQPTSFLFRDTYLLNLLYFRAQQFRLPEVRGYYSHLENSYRSRPWQGMRDSLDELHDICRKNRIDLRIAIFPFLHNLGPAYPFRHAHEVLRTYCHERRIPVLDLEPVLTPHVQEGLTVNRLDAHPNARAHELAAEAMKRDLLGDLFQ